MRLAAALAAVAAVLAGCGADEGGGGLSWSGTPQVIVQPELPDDRILTGSLRNDSGRTVRLEVADARLVDASGRAVVGTIRFAASFSRGLYSPRRAPAEGDPEFERLRLGELAVLGAGETAPVTVSWRGRAPAALRIGALELALR